MAGSDPRLLDASISRRRFILAGLGVVAAASLPRRALATSIPALEVAPGLVVARRAAWANGLAPKGPLQPEGHVRFLLVHHTAQTNAYAQGDVPAILQGIFAYHTGAKGWNDVAYNFFVDRYGQVWEGRTGSLDGPVVGDATGGNQGFDQLCCFVGNHQEAPPTAEAVDAMVRLLAWLATRYRVDPSPAARVSFVSRGSNRWPAGTRVTTRTIAGHREMSQTICPGDYAFALLGSEIPTRVASIVASTPSPSPTETPHPSPARATTPARPSPTASHRGAPVATTPPKVTGEGLSLVRKVIAAASGALALIGGATLVKVFGGRRQT
jgi:N-acetylmuramoyl-L-alanine amidase